SCSCECAGTTFPDIRTSTGAAGGRDCGVLQARLPERAVHCSRNDPGEESSCAATALSPGAGTSPEVFTCRTIAHS
ncbi:NaCP60E, partial [Symbiodinium microadriaticum]